MEYGISHLAIIPMRKEAREQSEMVSQLLFGETYEVLERTEKWVRIISTHDGYEGWISWNQVTELNDQGFTALAMNKPVLTAAPVTTAKKIADGSLLYLPSGSTLPGWAQGMCSINNDVYEIWREKAGSDLISFAKTFLNTPYLWGGRTHFGIDCSGLVQAVFRQQGLTLKRDAYLQAEEGETVDFLPEAQAGDVAFFDNDEGRIVHVGIMLNNEQILHASGKVKIERVDNHGIYSEEYKRYTHKLRIIKRYL
ncbi:C40 family peptidase [Mucilaginibacter sp. KACC 22063]|uniref:C40 family peptidase n=1 Tax=Mucilaginibacter sp. KACC 22063 TaxID=3025666 RepID=UPI002366CE8B|nr:C40 family peptidase [Mucilaginibacter sp. KACC 22063]WDF53395.1 C40 family peptidase [Mucilaginibacter sp. KACC 22063]